MTCEVEIIVADSDNVNMEIQEFAHALRERITVIIREAELETKHINPEQLELGGVSFSTYSKLSDLEFRLIFTHDKAHVSLWSEITCVLIPWVYSYCAEHSLTPRGMTLQTFGERQRLKDPVSA